MDKINLFSIGLLFILLMGTACSNEKKIEEVNGDTRLSVTIATNVDGTKADLIATPEELQIRNYAIALFANEKGDEITGATDNRLDYREATVGDGQSSCTIEGLKAQVGKVYVVAVANATTDTYKGYEHYIDLKEATVTAEPGQLIKVGTSLAKLTKNNETVKMQLTQLAARVDFEVQVDQENSDGWRYEITDVEVYNVNKASDLVIEEYNTQKDLKNLSFTGNQKTISFYTYERMPDDTDPIKIKVNGVLIHKNSSAVQVKKSYSLTLNPKKTDDGSVKGDGVLHGNRYGVTGKIKPKSAFIIEWKILQQEEIPVDVPTFE